MNIKLNKCLEEEWADKRRRQISEGEEEEGEEGRGKQKKKLVS